MCKSSSSTLRSVFIHILVQTQQDDKMYCFHISRNVLCVYPAESDYQINRTNFIVSSLVCYHHVVSTFHVFLLQKVIHMSNNFKKHLLCGRLRAQLSNTISKVELAASLLILSFLSCKVKQFPRDTTNPTKDRPENVETLIYMRFRGRPHSHKTLGTFYSPAYTELISMQLFRDYSRRPDRLFLKCCRCTSSPMLIENDFWIILLRRDGRRKRYDKGTIRQR